VLNEVVVDRGASPYLCQLDLYIQGRQVTLVQGDGKYDYLSSMLFLIGQFHSCGQFTFTEN